MKYLTAFAAALALAAPAAAKTDKGLKQLEKASRRAASAIVGKLSGKVCVLDFTELAAPDATSEFGQKIAELVAARLVARTEGLDRMITRRMVDGGEAGAKDSAAKEAPAGKADADPLAFEVGVFYEGGDGRLYPLREGMVLNSKDNYALYLKPAKASFVYAYQVDSSQKAFKIFPNPDFSKAGNPLSPAEAWVPEGGDYLYLDRNPGREEIYVFATRAPAPALDALKTARLSDIETTIKTMGLAGRRGSQTLAKAKDTAGNPLELITRKLYAQGDFFWKLSFIHQ